MDSKMMLDFLSVRNTRKQVLKNESIKKKSANKAIFGHFNEWLRKSVLRKFHLRQREYLWHWTCIKTRNWAWYFWTWRLTMFPRFRMVITFVSKVSDTRRQWGREMSAPRSLVTDPFHSFQSICCNSQLLDIYIEVFPLVLPYGK